MIYNLLWADNFNINWFMMYLHKYQKSSSKLPLLFIAVIPTLMGIGQNGLLVSLPLLVDKTGINLSTWSIIISIGSILFLPSAPFWGRYSDINGPKSVVIQSLAGFTACFFILSVFSFLGSKTNLNSIWIISCLCLGRVIYGLTVSGMVPATQHWAILILGEDKRLEAITTVSAGLSTGRLLGPIVAIAALKVSAIAPLILLTLLPIVMLFITSTLPSPPYQKKKKQNETILSVSHSKRYLPYLTTALSASAALALLYYVLSPALSEITNLKAERISDLVGYILTLAAAISLLAQLFIVKSKKLNIAQMYQLGAFSIFLGYTIFLSSSWILFFIAMIFVAFGNALLVPAYTSKASEISQGQHGISSGYITMAHTCGYGIAALLAVTSEFGAKYPLILCVLSGGICCIFAAKYAGKIKKDKDVDIY
ncbi:permease [Photobacterium sp. SKA34]|uniref:MFS transporter n=1 Tax=Photobacterium sp. SKA34 TaxID=121723 RepID=UPI00006B89C4|nr:MFS transporter [Photobacterium sp. SKA34]EAR55202.1 permease [Photobacterium sp. SKA34]